MGINVFSKGKYKQIVVSDNISKSDIDSFEYAFNKQFENYEVTFLKLKSLPKKILDILHYNIYILKYHLIITVSHQRVSSYLNSLGFVNHLLSSRNIDNIHKDIKYKKFQTITIGGSADSLNKITQMLSSIPLADIAIFVVQHISEDAPLLLDKILKDKSSYKVLYPDDAQLIQNGYIYVAPPAYHMRVADGKIYLDDTKKVNHAKPSLSVLMSSVSKEYASANLTIMTCGYGNDGSDALKEIKENGSIVILSDPAECEAKDMLTNAIATTCYDYVLKIDELQSFLNTLFQTTVDKKDAINLFLKELHLLYGYDFTKYDRDSITRRIQSSMRTLGIDSFGVYIKEVLTRHSLFDELLLSISINVTKFFRKPESYLGLKKILQDEYVSHKSLKIWVAGSSSGEEPYSIAMLLDELNLYKNSLIYATDFNPIVIEEAKNGLYSKTDVNDSKQNANQVLREGSFIYNFETNEAFFAIKEFLKKNVLFFTHNLVSDKSFNHFDIISCKNVLIYFTPVLQKKVFQLFYDSLNSGGYLMLGESESLHEDFRNKFQVHSITDKIYKRI